MSKTEGEGRKLPDIKYPQKESKGEGGGRDINGVIAFTAPNPWNYWSL